MDRSARENAGCSAYGPEVEALIRSINTRRFFPPPCVGIQGSSLCRVLKNGEWGSRTAARPRLSFLPFADPLGIVCDRLPNMERPKYPSPAKDPVRTSGHAIASAACAFVGLALWGNAFAPDALVVARVGPAIVLGGAALALARTARIRLAADPDLKGKKLALAGAIVGVILVLPSLVFVHAMIGSLTQK